MANSLRDLGKTCPEVAELLTEEKWAEFFKVDVEAINEKNAIILANRGNRKESSDLENLDDDDRFRELDERDDLDDKDDDEDDDYTASRNSMRETLQAYDPNKAREEHEQMFVGDNIEKDEEEDNLFSGLGERKDDDSDEDKPIEDVYENNPLHNLYTDEEKELVTHEELKVEHIEDDTHDQLKENEQQVEQKEDVSESSSYYDNSYWQISQFSIEDLLHN
jgi:hypothetical protein